MRGGGAAADPGVGFATSFDPGDGLRPRYNTLGALTPVYPRPFPTEHALGIIYTGQSVAANFSTGALYTASSARSLQLNIMDGRVYAMADPTFDCDGTGGSPGSAIGDSLIPGKRDRVCLANVSFGSTTSAQWANGANNLSQGFKMALAGLRAHGYTDIVHFHQQGEADANNGTSQATMLANLQAFDFWRRNAGASRVPMYVSQSTFPFGGWVTTDPNPVLWTPGAAATLIRNAQVAAVNGSTILAGPDCDLIRGAAYGRNAVAHPTLQAGPVAMATQWAALL